MTANLERALNGILRGWGHDVLLQRRNPENTAWINTLERHTVRHRYPSVRGVAQVLQEREEGLVHTVDMVFYFKGDAHPRERDRIIQRDNRFGGMNANFHPDYGETTWLIDYALPMRGRRGEVTYYICGATRETPS